jgi:hypothetical protein
MKRLSHWLDNRTEKTLEQARSTSRGGRAERRLLGRMQSFADHVRSLHQRLDNYESTPWDVRRDIRDLDSEARGVSHAIDDAGVFRATVEDWNATLQVLERMGRVASGETLQEGEGFFPHGGGSVTIGPGGVSVGGGWAAIREFRGLSAELEQSVSRVSERAERRYYDVRGPQREAVGDLRRFASQASDLRQRADSAGFDSRDARRDVERLRGSARDTEDSLRRAGAVEILGNEWANVTRILDRMAQIL